MKISFYRHSAALMSLLFLSFAAFRHTDAEVIYGKVLHAGTLQPVHDAYLYTVAGEEETFTKKDGSFALKTWQALPVECTIEHKDFSAKKVSVSKNNDKVIVYLVEK